MRLIQPAWPLPENVSLGWTTRQGGVSTAPFDTFNLARHVGDQDNHITENRARLLTELPGADDIRWLSQTHSRIAVDATQVENGIEADAAFTTQQRLACCVMTADCLPVFFWNEDGSQVAVAHAGWRGLADGILEATLSSFASPHTVSCGLGPSIGPDAFEVGEDVLQAFSNWPEANNCFQPRPEPGKWLADLPALAAAWLKQAGVTAVYASGECTYQQAARYFSYRRDGQTGRMANLIWLTP